MTRGNSLEQDMRLLINNPKYSDLEIICRDKKKLHGCKTILAARSEVFDRLLGLLDSRLFITMVYVKSLAFNKLFIKHDQV
ncbi:2866_t:CDS:2 [Funneliformis geosporum]|nr:2866_t:CDS:2 [Funneliformis geosporum]